MRWCGSISCCLYRFILEERPSVRVLASAVDDSFWLLINFNPWRWSCACVGIDNWVILLRARYKYNKGAQHVVTVHYHTSLLTASVELLRYLLGRAEQNHETPSVSRCQTACPNGERYQYKSEAFLLEPTCSATSCYTNSHHLITQNGPVILKQGNAVAQRLRCCATNRKVAGSIPDGVIGIFHWHKILLIVL